MVDFRAELEAKLTRVAQLAQASRWRRLWHTPGRYAYALGFREWVYPRTHRARPALATTFFGLPMRVLLPAGTDLFLLGAKTHASELQLARVLLRWLRPGATFVDVGAHFGYFTLLAARLVGPAGRVVAFEAAHGTHAVLAHNTRAQSTVLALHQALSDAPGTVSFFEFPVLYGEFNALNVDQYRHEPWYAQAQPTETHVAATTLDAVAEHLGLVPAVIKIDVEGAEDQVLHGARRTLGGAQSPLVVMEYLAPDRANASHRRAAAQLVALGYQPHAADDAGQLSPCADLEAHLKALGEDSTNFYFVKPSPPEL